MTIEMICSGCGKEVSYPASMVREPIAKHWYHNDCLYNLLRKTNGTA